MCCEQKCLIALGVVSEVERCGVRQPESELSSVACQLCDFGQVISPVFSLVSISIKQEDNINTFIRLLRQLNQSFITNQSNQTINQSNKSIYIKTLRQCLVFSKETLAAVPVFVFEAVGPTRVPQL